MSNLHIKEMIGNSALHLELKTSGHMAVAVANPTKMQNIAS